MRVKLTTEIQECYGHAAECRQRAKEARDPETLQDLLDMEGRWLSLARSYEFAEQLSRSLRRFSKHKHKKHRPSQVASVRP
jgi:hypothetical protein